MKRILIFAAVAVLSFCMLVGCGGNGEGEVTTTAPDNAGGTTDAPAVELPEIPEGYEQFTLSAENIEGYKIVRVDEVGDDEIAAVSAFADALNAKLGTNIRIGNDFLIPGEAAPAKEILFGDVARERSREIYENVGYNDYIITRDETRVIIAGGSVEALRAASEKLISLFDENGTLTVTADFMYTSFADTQKKDVKLSGNDLGKYTIIYSGKNNMVAAYMLRNEIGEASGIRLPVRSDKEEKRELEILVGNTNRNKTNVKEYYSYITEVKESKLCLSGYDSYALINAAVAVGEAIGEGGADSTLESVAISYSLPHYTEYIEDIDKLYMRWIAEWDPDPRMLDFELKKQALLGVSDRLLTNAHRSECDFYPENSIEGIISFYKMGGDVVELDIQATKDGVLVLMHDNTLTRMTNFAEVRGKVVNGIQLPTSDAVIDWTYEQIKQLNLKEAAGGNTAKVTPFKVPTLAEALKVCKNRLFVVPDKTDKWRYADVDGVLSESPNVFIYDAMVEANNFDSVLLSYGLNATTAVKLQKYIYEKTGVVSYILLRENSNTNSSYKALSATAIKNSFAIQVNGAYQLNFKDRYNVIFSELKDKILLAGWTINDTLDFEQYWQEMYDLGYRMIMTNDYLNLVKFASKTVKYD